MSRSKAGCADNNEIVNSEDQDQTVLLCSLISVHTIRIITCDSLTLIAKKRIITKIDKITILDFGSDYKVLCTKLNNLSQFTILISVDDVPRRLLDLT